MRKTVVLDEAAIREARNYTPHRSTSALVREAVAEYVATRQQQKLLNLEGRIDIDPDWQTVEARELTTTPTRKLRPPKTSRRGTKRPGKARKQ